MTILVDEAIWRWRGRTWAHLVSDRHLDELHEFAHRLGMPYLAFQGDHYDIHADLRQAAIAAGAEPVQGRRIVAALREAGLRDRGKPEAWSWWWGAPELDTAPLPNPIAASVEAAIAELVSTGLELGVATRPGEQLVVLTTTDLLPVTAGISTLPGGIVHHRSAGERGTFLEWQILTG